MLLINKLLKDFKCVDCYRCREPIYAITTSQGGDYVACPCCSFYDSKYIDNNRRYCQKCNILFEMSCTHAENGCTDDVLYSKFINKYTFDGNDFEGIPVFESINSAKKLLKTNRFKVIETICTCKGQDPFGCRKSSYPDSINQKQRCSNGEIH
jgi:hypothetical protein